MFNDSMRGITVFTYSVLQSVLDIIKTNSFSSKVSDKVQFVSHDGDIYYPLGNGVGLGNQPEGNIRIPTFMLEGDSTQLNLMNYRDYSQRYIADEITTVRYNKSIFLPTLLKQLAMDEKTYGLILQKGDYMVNPIHPAVAFSITAGLMEFPEEGELHVFQWSDEALEKIANMSNRQKKKEMEFYEKEYEGIFAAFSKLIKTPSTETRVARIGEESISRMVSSPLMEDLDITVEVSVSDDGAEGARGVKSLLIPLQLAIGDMAQPYYGFMFIESPKNDENTGHNLSPMMSGNLSQNMGEVSRYGSLDSAASSGNVCTSSYNSHTPAGWSTLSKVNLNSMFNPKLVSPNGVLSYVEVSKKIAGAIWADIETCTMTSVDDGTGEAEASEASEAGDA